MNRRGWCPGVYDPMASGDGLLVRVKPPGARLTQHALRGLADAARRHGNGAIDLTRRGYLQVRGLRADTVAPFAADMVEASLAHADPARERRRRVIAAPPFDAALVARIETAQEASDDWDCLPDKFAVSVNGSEGDIQIIANKTFISGDDLATDADPVDAMTRLVAAGIRLGGGRMGALVGRVGAAAVFAAAGLPARESTRQPIQAAASFCVAFGQLSAGMLLALAGTGVDVTLTPWRALLADITPDAAESLGLITDPADPRLRVAACAGRPACARASVPARSDAAFFARFASDLHVSGCAKGCARSTPAAVTLVGRDGRYDLIRNGRADVVPVRRGLTRAQVAELLAAP